MSDDAAHVPAEHGAVPGRQRATARLRGPLPRARAPPAAGRGPDRAAVRVVGDPGGLRGRRARRPVDVPDRLRVQDDRGQGARRRHVRHRGGRPATGCASSTWTPPALSRRPRRGSARGAHGRPGRDASSEPAPPSGLPGGAVARSAASARRRRCRATRRSSPGRSPPSPRSRCRATGAAGGRGRHVRLTHGHRAAAHRAPRDERRSRRCRPPRWPAPAGPRTDPTSKWERWRHAGHSRADGPASRSPCTSTTTTRAPRPTGWRRPRRSGWIPRGCSRRSGRPGRRAGRGVVPVSG